MSEANRLDQPIATQNMGEQLWQYISPLNTQTTHIMEAGLIVAHRRRLRPHSEVVQEWRWDEMEVKTIARKHTRDVNYSPAENTVAMRDLTHYELTLQDEENEKVLSFSIGEPPISEEMRGFKGRGLTPANQETVRRARIAAEHLESQVAAFQVERMRRNLAVNQTAYFGVLSLNKDHITLRANMARAEFTHLGFVPIHLPTPPPIRRTHQMLEGHVTIDGVSTQGTWFKDHIRYSEIDNLHAFQIICGSMPFKPPLNR